MLHPSFADSPDRLDDRHILVVEDIDEDATAILTIACDDPRFARYLEGGAE